ncbi:MAG: SIR2 family protein [Desulfurellaceae bacterium]|nr:SIR2 family protein [Desulfurellaceae bacterium]
MILVFVGAGGSAAVDPEQYPTTVEFFERLPDDITGDGLFIKIREFLRHKKGEEPIDIEEVLWNLDELQGYFQASLNANNMAGWIMAGNRIKQLIGNAPDLTHLLSGMVNLEAQILTLKNKINAQVYNFYATPPDPEKLSNWVRLLKGLEEVDPAIQIFTTNYDLVLETVIKEAEIKVKTGRSSNDIQMRLDIACWDHPHALTDDMGRLTKLHGSVDWQRHNEDIIVGNPNFTGNHQNHLILYPGYKEEFDQEPFIKFHDHLDEVVFKTDVAIFIGFAFRDDEINDTLSYLPSESRKYVINKDDSLPDLPFFNGCEHFNGGFTAEAVEACLRSLRPQNAQEYDDSDFKANSAYLDTLPPTPSSQPPSTKES